LAFCKMVLSEDAMVAFLRGKLAGSPGACLTVGAVADAATSGAPYLRVGLRT